MKYTGMPMGMWALFAGSFQKQLAAVFGYDTNTAKGITKKAKSQYRQIIRRLPEFEKGDRFKMNLVNCAMIGAFILSMPERPDVEQLTEYYAKSMMTKPMKWFCQMSGKSKFTEKDIAGMKSTAALRAADRNPYSWNMEFYEYPDGSGYEGRFTKCGICVLMQKLGLYDLTPALCRLDYTMSEAGGATDFVRQYTLASDGPYCDCGYKRKNCKVWRNMLVRTMTEEEIYDIGHAFGYYDYGQETGMPSAFSGQDETAEYICAYVRGMLRGGFLHTTSERSEGYIAYKLPKQKLGVRTLWLIAKGMLRNSTLKRLVRFAMAIKRGGVSLQDRMGKEKKPYIFVGLVCVREKYQRQGYMRKVMDMAFAEGDRLGVPVILETDAKSKCDKYVHLGMELAGVRDIGEFGKLYDLIKYPEPEKQQSFIEEAATPK